MPGWVLDCREAVVQADSGGTFTSPVSRPEATLPTAPLTFCRCSTASRVFVVQAVGTEHLVYIIEHSCYFVKEGSRPFHNGDKGCFGVVNGWLKTVLHLDISDL